MRRVEELKSFLRQQRAFQVADVLLSRLKALKREGPCLNCWLRGRGRLPGSTGHDWHQCSIDGKGSLAEKRTELKGAIRTAGYPRQTHWGCYFPNARPWHKVYVPGNQACPNNDFVRDVVSVALQIEDYVPIFASYGVQVMGMSMSEIALVLVSAGHDGFVTTLLDIWAHIVFWREVAYQV